MHRCRYCGFYCDCDGEDHDQPSPPECPHDCSPDEDGDEDGGWAVDTLHSDSLWDDDRTASDQGERT